MAKKKAGRGNQGFECTDEVLNQITEWIATGESISGICRRLEISRQAFYNRMKSDNARFCDDRGNNLIKGAVELGRAMGGEPIIQIIYDKATDKDHKEQLRAGMWYAEKVLNVGKEPTVIVVNETGETVDKSQEEMVELLKQHRSKLQVVK